MPSYLSKCSSCHYTPWFLAVFLFYLLPQTAGANEQNSPPPSYRELIRAANPMGTEGLEAQLAGILRKYYARTFGGRSNWEQIQSVRFDGRLHLREGAVRFVAFKKKPDYCKVVIMTGGGSRLALAYDGTDPWQLDTGGAEPQPVHMPPAEARNFIRDATIGGHLLYPLIEGKTIKLAGFGEVGGRRCYEIEVVLPGGQRILSSLDISDLSERHQVTVNAVNGLVERTTFSDFRVIDGVRFPFASVMESDGEVVHRVEMLDIQVNRGVMPWMFQRPSGAYAPGKIPETSHSDLFEQPPDSERKEAESLRFGAPAGTAFPDPGEESEIRSLLDDIGKPIR